MTAAGTAALFILSFRHRDELTKVAEEAGWQPIAARRAANAEARFIASDASVAVVDARGALGEGHEAVRMLADPAEANAAALLVLLSRNDGGALDRFHADGATHFLVSPFSEHQFVKAVQFAGRHADRVGGGYRTRRRADSRDDASWRWRPGSSTVELSPALARRAGLGEEQGRRISLMELFRKLDADGRKAARAAVDRVLATGGSTAFAHEDGAAGACVVFEDLWVQDEPGDDERREHQREVLEARMVEALPQVQQCEGLQGPADGDPLFLKLQRDGYGEKRQRHCGEPNESA